MFCTPGTKSRMSSVFWSGHGVAIYSLRWEMRNEKLSLDRKWYKSDSRLINKMLTYLAGKYTYLKWLKGKYKKSKMHEWKISIFITVQKKSSQAGCTLYCQSSTAGWGGQGWMKSFQNFTPPASESRVRVSDCCKIAFNTRTSTFFMLASAKNRRPVDGESCSECGVLTPCQKKNKFTLPRNIIIHESTFSGATKKLTDHPKSC